jgi:phosphomannomutase
VRAVRDALAGRIVNDTDGIRVSGPDGWWLLRASNTEAKLSARAEGYTPEGLARVLADLDAHLAAVGVVRGR